MDYYEKKKIRSVLQGLKKQKSRDDIQRKRSMDWGRQFSTEQLNNMRNSLESVIALQFIRTYNCLTSLTCAKPKEKMAFPA